MGMTQFETQLIQELRKLNNNLSDLNKELRKNKVPTTPIILNPSPPLSTKPTCDITETKR